MAKLTLSDQRRLACASRATAALARSLITGYHAHIWSASGLPPAAETMARAERLRKLKICCLSPSPRLLVVSLRSLALPRVQELELQVTLISSMQSETLQSPQSGDATAQRPWGELAGWNRPDGCCRSCSVST